MQGYERTLAENEYRELQDEYERVCARAAEIRKKLLAVKVARFEESIK